MSQAAVRSGWGTRQASKSLRPASVRLGFASRALKSNGPCRDAQVSRRAVQVSAANDSSMGMDPDLKKSIDGLISANKIVVFMKGSRMFPQCGFSNNVVQILNATGAKYETVDILSDARLRTGMKEYSQWPTFPQVYVNGEFFGGCDIMIEAYNSGELAEIVEVALNS